jgi:hypothetical protein
MGGRAFFVLLLFSHLFYSVVAQTCSKRCDSSSLCQLEPFTNCQVTCDNAWVTAAAGVCLSSDFSNSNVQCVNGACQNAVFNQSTVTCNGDDCNGGLFYASAVTCNGFRLTEPTTWLFDCSCCDSDSNSFKCPTDWPSCKTNLVSFCKTISLGRTCKEWGNPVCDSLTIGTYFER